MFEFLGEIFQSMAKPKPTETIYINEDELVRRISDGTVESVRWQDLKRVSIVTTDQGPWLEDVFFVFEGNGAGVAIGQEWQEKVKIFDWLNKKLEGVDYEQVCLAMACTDNANFSIWDAAKPGCRLADLSLR